MGHEIQWQDVGLVGIGRDGSRVAALAHAFGMDVVATTRCSPPTRSPVAAQPGRPSTTCWPVGHRLAALPARRFNPEDDERDRVRAHEGGARFFVSTARGGIHDEAALANALQTGHLGGAGIDVWDQEPPALDHPLSRMDNVYATFHTAGVTHEARRNVAELAADQIVGLLRGDRPPRLVNPEVWPELEKRRSRIL